MLCLLPFFVVANGHLSPFAHFAHEYDLLFPAIDVDGRQFQPILQTVGDNGYENQRFVGRKVAGDFYRNRNHQFFPCLVKAGSGSSDRSVSFFYGRLRL